MKLTLHHWNSLLISSFAIAATSYLTSCNNSDEPATMPVVTTAAVSNITTTTATAGGTITSTGNATITEAGIVYSSSIATPTTGDTKVASTDMDGEFTVALSALKSGTTFNVRAFATNSVGTSYGEVVHFTSGNEAPTITSVTITGNVEVNKTAHADYVYHDSENDAQGASTFQWYTANDASGAGAAKIEGATAVDFTLTEAQDGKYISVGVTPKASTGTATGTEVKSAYAKVGEATTVTFTYNKNTVTYGIIISATTQKRWLDRNLGASAAATAFDDYAHNGDLFQWGRGDDGHQLVTRTGPTNADASGSPTTTTLATSDTPGDNKFILGGDPDWRSTKNDALWQGVNGINNPCPKGWRLPTQAEWEAEGITSLSDGFTKLKMVRCGRRSGFNGSFVQTTSAGNYWTSSINPDQSQYTIRMYLGDSEFSADFDVRSDGKAVRCIKD